MSEPLPITSIDIYRVEKDIDNPYRLSYGSITKFFATVYHVHSGDYSGLGEAIVTDHNLAIRLAKPLIGKDCRHPHSVLARFDVTEFTHRACREALSFAIYDLVGKATRKPIWEMLGGRRRDSFPLRPVSFIRDPADMAKHVRQLEDEGFTAVKIKLSGDADADVRSIRSIRSTCNSSLDIQADANFGYATGPSFLEMLSQCPGRSVDIIEDPCELDTSRYAQLREKLARFQTLLMLDTPARTMDDVDRICDSHAADIVNHHPNCVGGPDLLSRFQERIHTTGLLNAIGGATGYFGIADVCYYSVATAIGSGPVEQTPTEMYQGVRISPNPHALREGSIQINRGITGTGAELDKKALASVMIDHTRIPGKWNRFFRGWLRK